MHTVNDSFNNGGTVNSLVRRFRILILTSPFWLAALSLVLARLMGNGVAEALQFLTASPLR
jgi:hypothetical protein